MDLIIFTGPKCLYSCSFCYQKVAADDLSQFQVKDQHEFESILKSALHLVPLFNCVHVEGGEISLFPVDWFNTSLFHELCYSTKVTLFTANVEFAHKLIETLSVPFTISLTALSRKHVEFAHQYPDIVSLKLAAFKKFEKLLIEYPSISPLIPSTLHGADVASLQVSILKRLANVFNEEVCSLVRERRENTASCSRVMTLTKYGLLAACTRSFIYFDSLMKLQIPQIDKLDTILKQSMQIKGLYFEKSWSSCMKCSLFQQYKCPGRCYGRTQNDCHFFKKMYSLLDNCNFRSRRYA